MLRRYFAILVAAVAAIGTTLAAESDQRPVTVFAAASLTNALEKIGQRFTESTGVPVRYSFASSSTLARQIEAGAPADAFFSADLEWMDYLEQRGEINKSSRHNLLGNQLVLIAPIDSKVELKIEPGFDLAATLGKGRLATGDPDSVPVGRYARVALMSLGVWDDVADRLVRAEDVRHALAFVARGEAPLGIVYVTDARVDKRVRIVGAFPADSHPPITYPVALTPRAGPAAARFAEFVRGEASHTVFEEFGFTVLK
jgi:molybdate transport system substrate-binding protein